MPREQVWHCWAEIGSDDEPRFTHDVAGLFIGKYRWPRLRLLFLRNRMPSVRRVARRRMPSVRRVARR